MRAVLRAPRAFRNVCGRSDFCRRQRQSPASVSMITVECSSTRNYTRPPHHAVSRRWIVSELQSKVTQGQLREDAAQRVVAKKLHRLLRTLETYDNQPLIRQLHDRDDERKRSKRLTDDASRKEDEGNSSETPTLAAAAAESAGASEYNDVPLPAIPRGLYIHGSVGTGKSMLMDMFHANMRSTTRKKRFHFHAFMSMVHQRIHCLKQDALRTHGRNFTVDTTLFNNPVYQVGLQLSEEMTLLCLDEFQVTDIADALMLRLLFSVLWANGTVVVATSNRPPRVLYQGGINYGYFEPFVGLLEKHCVVVGMDSDVDYRSLVFRDDSESSFFSLSNEQSPEHIRQSIDIMVAKLRGDAQLLDNLELSLGHNRTLTISNADDKGLVARLDFESLCHSDLGASDYRRLAQAFDVLVVEHIPVLTLSNHDAARRFITLADEMYEQRTGLICSASAVDPDSLFVHSFYDMNANGNDDDIQTPEGWLDQATRGGHAVGALASVQELGFAFQRAASRLKEMTSQSWWKRSKCS